MNEYKLFALTLGTALQNGLYYTFSHPETAHAVERNYQFADKIFQEKGNIIFTVTRDAAFINSVLTKVNPHVIDYLFKFFSERSYTGIALTPGLMLKEHHAFIQILSDSKGMELADIDRSLTSYDISHAKIIFYQPRLGDGKGSGIGSGGAGSGGQSSGGLGEEFQNIAPGSATGSIPIPEKGHFIGLGSDYSPEEKPSAMPEPETPEKEEPIRHVTVELNEEDIAAILNNDMTEEEMEKKYDLIPFSSLNSYEKTQRLGTLPALPFDSLDHLDLMQLYNDVVDIKQNDVLQYYTWLFDYNIGDLRVDVKHKLLEEALTLCRQLPDTAFPAYALLFTNLLLYITAHQNEYTSHCFNLFSQLTFHSIKKAAKLKDLASLNNWIPSMIQSGLAEHFSKKDFFDMVESLITLLRNLIKSPERVQVENLLLECGELAITPLLTTLMDEQDKDVRRQIISLFVKSGKKAIPFLKRMLRDSRWFVIRNGIKILGEIGSFDDLSFFTPLTEHKDPRVREELASALKNISHPQAIPLLLGMIRKESSPEVKTAMIPGIAEAADRKSMDILFEIVKENYKNASFTPFCEEALKEFALFTQKNSEFADKLFTVFEWDHTVALFKEDHVQLLKEFLINHLKQHFSPLYEAFNTKIRKSGHKNIKKFLK